MPCHYTRKAESVNERSPGLSRPRKPGRPVMLPPLLGDLIIVIPIPESCHYRNVAIVRIIQSKNQADIAAICILRAIPYSVVIRKEGFDGSYRLD